MNNFETFKFEDPSFEYSLPSDINRKINLASNSVGLVLGDWIEGRKSSLFDKNIESVLKNNGIEESDLWIDNYKKEFGMYSNTVGGWSFLCLKLFVESIENNYEKGIFKGFWEGINLNEADLNILNDGVDNFLEKIKRGDFYSNRYEQDWINSFAEVIDEISVNTNYID